MLLGARCLVPLAPTQEQSLIPRQCGEDSPGVKKVTRESPEIAIAGDFVTRELPENCQMCS